MSWFSDVDAAPAPDNLVTFLDLTADAEAGMKHYIAAAHARERPDRPILDIGSGAGHDLIILGRHGLAAVGVEPSAVMIQAARERPLPSSAALVQARGEALPFRAESFAGCRIERVLMHADDPGQLLAEAARCVRPGGLVTVFEPDFSRLQIESDVLPGDAAWITNVRHPGIGGALWSLLEAAGCHVVDRVEELSVWSSLSTLVRVARFPTSVERAVAMGLLDPATAQSWVEEQRRRDAAGRFRALLPKVLVVARKR